MSLSRGMKVVLPKGKTIGMGKLKKDTEATVEATEVATDGSLFYRVRYLDAKGRERTTYYSPTHGNKTALKYYTMMREGMGGKFQRVLSDRFHEDAEQAFPRSSYVPLSRLP